MDSALLHYSFQSFILLFTYCSFTIYLLFSFSTYYLPIIKNRFPKVDPVLLHYSFQSFILLFTYCSFTIYLLFFFLPIIKNRFPKVDSVLFTIYQFYYLLIIFIFYLLLKIDFQKWILHFYITLFNLSFYFSLTFLLLFTYYFHFQPIIKNRFPKVDSALLHYSFQSFILLFTYFSFTIYLLFSFSTYY